MPFKLRSEPVPNTPPRKFERGGWKHYYIRVFIEAEGTSNLRDVDMVVYVLDPSFEDERFVVSVDRRSNFETEIWTYAPFNASAKILLKDKTYETIAGDVSLERVPEDELSRF